MTSSHWSKELRREIQDRLIDKTVYQSGDVKQATHRDVRSALDRLDLSRREFEFARLEVNAKPCVSLTNNLEKALDAATATYLRHTFSLQSHSRHVLVRRLVSTLREVGPAMLYRRDVKSCFESIDRESLVGSVLEDSRVTAPAARVLELYSDTCKVAGVRGLSRGTALSSALCEYALSTVDQRLRKASGVYFYARFVDDFVVLQAEPSPVAADLMISESLRSAPGQPQLGTEKVANVLVGGEGDSHHLNGPFEFLGYVFSSTPTRGITIDMAASKVRRVKSKLIVSFQAYLKTGDFHELLSSVKYLTGNTALVRRGVKSRAMLTGIYYNYPEITPDTYDSGSLRDLDSFLRSVVRGKRTDMSLSIRRRLTQKEASQLLRCSFVAGHRDRIYVKMSRSAAQRLVERWKRVEG